MSDVGLTVEGVLLSLKQKDVSKKSSSREGRQLEFASWQRVCNEPQARSRCFDPLQSMDSSDLANRTHLFFTTGLSHRRGFFYALFDRAGDEEVRGVVRVCVGVQW